MNLNLFIFLEFIHILFILFQYYILKENNIDFKYAKSKVARFVATLKRDKD